MGWKDRDGTGQRGTDGQCAEHSAHSTLRTESTLRTKRDLRTERVGRKGGVDSERTGRGRSWLRCHTCRPHLPGAVAG